VRHRRGRWRETRGEASFGSVDLQRSTAYAHVRHSSVFRPYCTARIGGTAHGVPAREDVRPLPPHLPAPSSSSPTPQVYRPRLVIPRRRPHSLCHLLPHDRLRSRSPPVLPRRHNSHVLLLWRVRTGRADPRNQGCVQAVRRGGRRARAGTGRGGRGIWESEWGETSEWGYERDSDWVNSSHDGRGRQRVIHTRKSALAPSSHPKPPPLLLPLLTRPQPLLSPIHRLSSFTITLILTQRRTAKLKLKSKFTTAPTSNVCWEPLAIPLHLPPNQLPSATIHVPPAQTLPHEPRIWRDLRRSVRGRSKASASVCARSS
jgi:hypothetical protein